MAVERHEPITVLVAEDDEEDRQLVLDAWHESRLANQLRFVADGEELLDYLLRRGAYERPTDAPAPDLILMDFDMPGRPAPEILEEMKRRPGVRRIPVVVLTTSQASECVARCYAAGASSFIAKPVTFDKLVEVLKILDHYWFEIVELPPRSEGGDSGGSA
ncbi:MAG: response regulator [Candidatus Brocadiia bacterium]